MNAWAMTVPPHLFGLEEESVSPVTVD